MSELTSRHLDDFTLLRHIAGELTADERPRVADHLSRCAVCAQVEREIVLLDAELRDLQKGEAFRGVDDATAPLPPGDPFRSRPPVVERRVPRGKGMALATAALNASEQAAAGCAEILELAGRAETRTPFLENLSLSDVSHRFALLYALQEAGRRIAESPARAARLAQEALARLRRDPFPGASDEAERIVPRLLLRGQAHLLAGQAGNWTREFGSAGSHLEIAYRCFARGGDEMGLAMVELVESQRRSFTRRGAEGLLLARRAERTFEELGLEDLEAKAWMACGLAFFDLDRQDEAVESYRRALPVFESLELWSNYVGALNSIGTSLARIGRLDEARQEYARALRRLPCAKHPSLRAFIRHGLADILFASGRYREAAITLSRASRLYSESGLIAWSLTASLYEVESWARQGNVARARHRLDLFLVEVSRHRALEESVAREIDDALRGSHPDLERIASLRQHTAALLSESLPAPA